MSEKKLRILPLGGLGEVGKNMTVLEYGRNIIIIDVGLMFPEFDMLGVDHLIPDTTYLNDKSDLIRGIVFTHGHEDHVGAIEHFLDQFQNIPMYASPFTCGIVERKLTAKQKELNPLTEVLPGDKVKIGPFDIEFFRVCHSIPDSCGLGITTPVGLIVHMGDFKLDNTPVDRHITDLAKLSEFGRRGVLALLSDSTNADKPGWNPSEAVIDGAFSQIFAEAKGRILVGSFSSLTSRVQQVINAAHKYGRKVALVGTSMVANCKLATKLGYLQDPGLVLTPLEKVLSMPRAEVVIMSTGSQGETESILGRLSTGQNKQFEILEGDTVVVSAHPIPGNEEVVWRMVNKLIQQGAKVIYDPVMPVHVSGHARAEEQKQILGILRPKFFVPVHGELRHLNAHSELARQMGVPTENIVIVENGAVIELTEKKIKVVEQLPMRHIYVDGSGVGDIGPAVLRERDMLANAGFVLINLMMDAETGALLSDPELTSRGFVFVRDSQELFGIAQRRVSEFVEKNPELNQSSLRREVEKLLVDFFYAETKRRPMVLVTLNSV